MRLTALPRTLLRGAALLAAGLAYYAFASVFGGVPCPFRLVTGLKCPGCGITTMILALGRGDVGAALAANPFLLVTLPLPVGLALRQAWLRAKGGHFGRAENALCLIYAVLLLGWGVLRNLPGPLPVPGLF